ncbi:MAG: hypothetical protein V4580_18100 [Bacteroidota bacterium]
MCIQTTTKSNEKDNDKSQPGGEGKCPYNHDCANCPMATLLEQKPDDVKH